MVGEDGYVRPDMIVHLPGGGQVVIDSKVPLEAFLQYIEADDDDTRSALLEKHAKQLRTHIDQLAKKEYWQQLDRSPEFVVAFIPGEPLLAAALEADPALQEHALNKRIILATPNTLVAALRTIALSWQQETLAENHARSATSAPSSTSGCARGRGTCRRCRRALPRVSMPTTGRSARSSRRVLVTARKFPSLGVVGGERAEITELSPIEERAAPSAVGRRRRRVGVGAAEHLAVARQHGRRPAVRAPAGLNPTATPNTRRPTSDTGAGRLKGAARGSSPGVS